MAMRSTWSGTLKISLLSIPVRVYCATESSSTPSFNKLHMECGCRLKQHMFCEKCQTTVGNDSITKGYKVSGPKDKDEKFVFVSDSELEALKLDSSRNLIVDRFIPETELNPLLIEDTDYLAPGKEAEDAFAAVRQAMAGQLGIAKMMARGREFLIALRAAGPGILLHYLRPANELRAMSMVTEYSAQPEVPEETVDMARQVIGTLRGTIDPEMFRDRYADRVQQLVDAKAKGEQLALPAAPIVEKPTNNLMDALRQSLAAAGKVVEMPVKMAAAPVKMAATKSKVKKVKAS